MYYFSFVILFLANMISSRMISTVRSRLYSSPAFTATITMSGSSSGRPNVVLDKGKARLFKDGNPIIYGGAVKETRGAVSAGDEVDVFDHQENLIGRGFFNPDSQYRVRMFVQKKEKEIFALSVEEIIAFRIERAKSLRMALTLPSASNSVYRLVNGEGDRLGYNLPRT